MAPPGLVETQGNGMGEQGGIVIIPQEMRYEVIQAQRRARPSV